MCVCVLYVFVCKMSICTYVYTYIISYLCILRLFVIIRGFSHWVSRFVRKCWLRSSNKTNRYYNLKLAILMNGYWNNDDKYDIIKYRHTKSHFYSSCLQHQNFGSCYISMDLLTQYFLFFILQVSAYLTAISSHDRWRCKWCCRSNLDGEGNPS